MSQFGLFRYPSTPDLLDVKLKQLNTTQWHLPNGVKARIGKGTVNDLAYSPNNTILAVASSTGTWLYEIDSGNELALLTKNREEFDGKRRRLTPEFNAEVVYDPELSILYLRKISCNYGITYFKLSKRYTEPSIF